MTTVRKKRRFLKDAEDEVKELKSMLQDAKMQLVLLARENAQAKLQLRQYMEHDDSLVSASQLTCNSQSFPDMFGLDAVTKMDVDEDSAFVEEDGIGLNELSQFSDIGPMSQLENALGYLEKQHRMESIWESQEKESFSLYEKGHHVVRVGIGVVLCSGKYPGAVLVGERKGSHGDGLYAFPGGHLEIGETFQQCAKREVGEETGLMLEESEFSIVHVSNDFMEKEERHYVTITLKAMVEDTSLIENREPEKCKGWKWQSWSNLQHPANRSKLFPSLKNIITSNFNPFNPMKITTS